MEKKITVIPNDEKNVECNCCDWRERETDQRLWKLSIKTGNRSNVFRLCDKHLQELRGEIDQVL